MKNIINIIKNWWDNQEIHEKVMIILFLLIFTGIITLNLTNLI